MIQHFCDAAPDGVEFVRTAAGEWRVKGDPLWPAEHFLADSACPYCDAELEDEE